MDMPLTAITNTTIDVRATHPSTGVAINMTTGANRVLTGQLLMLEKGSTTTLVQITGVDYPSRAHHVRQRRFAEAESDGRSRGERGGAPRRRPRPTRCPEE